MLIDIEISRYRDIEIDAADLTEHVTMNNYNFLLILFVIELTIEKNLSKFGF